ncbi:hypothetical protein DEM27_05910 [Metarhizobium album]|uniref:Uncharacterized protein n=1 Tax=Metarhizobium album TaxID=2182425 RepID=A0A2U2DV45_9HYPH|nr:hypothetical protein DEM27_05910 [Rhizobium album]
MIMRQCIFAYSHIQTALQIATEQPECEELIAPLAHALAEIRIVQGKIQQCNRTRDNVVPLRVADCRSKKDGDDAASN